jgi:diguanylate cyclase (GGDEF)-like protein
VALPWTAVVGLQVDWPLALFALLATLITAGLLFSLVRRPGREQSPGSAPAHRERRRTPVSGRREAREALALVGDALAATHNPRALMPVILNVITEATGARGGRLLEDGVEVGWVGDLDETPGVEFDLSAGDETTHMKLVLHPPDGGFGEETTKLAEWLCSQAAIALENARLHDIVQWQAITDELTGLVNRRRFLDALGSEVTKGQRLGARLSVVLTDLDDFKLINDGFGHHAGDEVLLAFADLLRAHGRDVDVAARLGGEEFAILLPETGLDGASVVAELLRQSLAERRIRIGENVDVTVTASFGVAELEEGQSVDALLRAADSALYRAKELGKNRVGGPVEQTGSRAVWPPHHTFLVAVLDCPAAVCTRRCGDERRLPLARRRGAGRERGQGDGGPTRRAAPAGRHLVQLARSVARRGA